MTSNASFKEILKTKSLVYLFIIVIFFLTSCKSTLEKHLKPNAFDEITTPISSDDRIWMEKFLREFFLDSTCIYTLFGTKPLAGKEIIYASEDDWKKAALPHLKELDAKKKEQLLQKISRESQSYDFHKNWEKWVSFIKKYPNAPFIFAKRPTSTEKISIGYILNVQETVWTLQKYYSIFKNELGQDFDPVKATMEFADPNSHFWEKVLSNHILMGIVYGYGYKNSYFFSMYINQPNGNLGDHSLFSSSVYEQQDDSDALSLKTLPLPMFRSFKLPFNSDPVLEKYKAERVKIQSELTEKTFFQKTLQQLTGLH